MPGATPDFDTLEPIAQPDFDSLQPIEQPIGDLTKTLNVPQVPSQDESQRLAWMQQQGVQIPQMEPTAGGELKATIGEGMSASPADFMGTPTSYLGGLGKAALSQVNPGNLAILSGIGGGLKLASKAGPLVADAAKAVIEGGFMGQGAKMAARLIVYVPGEKVPALRLRSPGMVLSEASVKVPPAPLIDKFG